MDQWPVNSAHHRISFLPTAFSAGVCGVLAARPAFSGKTRLPATLCCRRWLTPFFCVQTPSLWATPIYREVATVHCSPRAAAWSLVWPEDTTALFYELNKGLCYLVLLCFQLVTRMGVCPSRSPPLSDHFRLTEEKLTQNSIKPRKVNQNKSRNYF